MRLFTLAELLIPPWYRLITVSPAGETSFPTVSEVWRKWMESAMPGSVSDLPGLGGSEGSLEGRRCRELTMKSGVDLEGVSETPTVGGRINWRSETEKIPPSLIYHEQWKSWKRRRRKAC